MMRTMISSLKEKLQSYSFLFTELAKRDFKKKYKRSVLGILWSVLSPVLTMLVMRLVFTQFFGRGADHYTTYILAGNIVFNYFRETTGEGMHAITSNAGIITKMDVPKELFVYSKIIALFINFVMSILVFFVFCLIDGITFGWHFLMLVYPVACLTVFSMGVAMLLSALFVFLKDVNYLWGVFLRLLTYCSAIFYSIEGYPAMIQTIFLCNPVYVYILYFRTIAIDGAVPSLLIHGLCLLYALLAFVVGRWVFKRKEDRFIFYF